MNREYLLEQLELIDEYLARARSIATRGREAILADKILIDAAVREITVLFETCHNIAKHLIHVNNWREATSTAEAFEILSDHDVIESKISEAMRQASRFRNLATYRSAILDENIVVEILTNDIDDFERFVVFVARWLESQEIERRSHE